MSTAAMATKRKKEKFFPFMLTYSSAYVYSKLVSPLYQLMMLISLSFLIQLDLGLKCSAGEECYLNTMISSAASRFLLYCCRQMLQQSCRGWSPLVTVARRLARDQWRSWFSRLVVVSSKVCNKSQRYSEHWPLLKHFSEGQRL